jgi:hypothetical protein
VGDTADATRSWGLDEAALDFAKLAFQPPAERYPYGARRHWLHSGTSRTRTGASRRRPRRRTSSCSTPLCAIKKVTGDAVGGGCTAPRGGTGDVAPVDWITACARPARGLDAYAHHPYPIKPKENAVERRLRSVSEPDDGVARPPDRRGAGARFGSKTRIWLTEYGYQTNRRQAARGLGAPAVEVHGRCGARAYRSPQVDMLHLLPHPRRRAVSRGRAGCSTTGTSRSAPRRRSRVPITQLSRKGAHVHFGARSAPGRASRRSASGQGGPRLAVAAGLAQDERARLLHAHAAVPKGPT